MLARSFSSSVNLDVPFGLHTFIKSLIVISLCALLHHVLFIFNTPCVQMENKRWPPTAMAEATEFREYEKEAPLLLKTYSLHLDVTFA